MKMNCSDYQELISAFLDNALRPGEVELLESHFKACLDCQEEMSELESLRALFQHHVNSKPYPKASPHFAAKVIDSLRREAKSNVVPPHESFSILERVKQWLRQPQLTRWLAFTSVLALIFLFAGLLLSSLRENSRDKFVYELESPRISSVSLNRKNNLQYYLEEHALKAAEYPIAGNKGLIEYVKNTRK